MNDHRIPLPGRDGVHWKAKSAAFRILSVMPFGEVLHHVLQRHVTHEWPRSESVLDELIVAARDILAACHFAGNLSEAQFLEIGSGRDVAVALALRMLGVGAVVTIDVERLAQLDLINHSAQYLGRKLHYQVPVFTSFEELFAFFLKEALTFKSGSASGAVVAPAAEGANPHRGVGRAWHRVHC